LVGARTADPEIRTQIQNYLLTFLQGEGSNRAAQKDLRVATIISLGLIADPNRKAIPILEQYFAANRKREEVICSQVPTSIARLLRDAPVSERERYVNQVVGELQDRARAEQTLRPSFPQALGILTRFDDPFVKKVVESIQEKVEKELTKNP